MSRTDWLSELHGPTKIVGVLNQEIAIPSCLHMVTTNSNLRTLEAGVVPLLHGTVPLISSAQTHSRPGRSDAWLRWMARLSLAACREGPLPQWRLVSLGSNDKELTSPLSTGANIWPGTQAWTRDGRLILINCPGNSVTDWSHNWKQNYSVRGSVVLEALCYKPEGRGVETRWGEHNFFLFCLNPRT
jgi:hypothetical protein